MTLPTKDQLAAARRLTVMEDDEGEGRGRCTVYIVALDDAAGQPIGGIHRTPFDRRGLSDYLRVKAQEYSLEVVW